jgi:hypothetical protein
MVLFGAVGIEMNHLPRRSCNLIGVDVHYLVLSRGIQWPPILT